MASNKQISARIPKHLYQRFTEKLAKEGKQSGKVLQQLIEAYCNDALPSGSDMVASSSGEDKEAKKNDIDIKQLVADEVTTATHHLETKINQLESAISKMSEDTQAITDRQQTIEGRLELVEDIQTDLADREQFLEGLSCLLPLPIKSDSTPIVDGSNMVQANQVKSNSTITTDDSTPIADGSNMVEPNQVEDETMTQQTDNWEPLMTLDEVEAKYGRKPDLPEPLTQSQLADRLGCHPKSIANNLKKGSPTKANKFCEKRKDYYWRWSEQDGKFYPQHDPFKED